jgi:hypothetical protein
VSSRLVALDQYREQLTEHREFEKRPASTGCPERLGTPVTDRYHTVLQCYNYLVRPWSAGTPAGQSETFPTWKPLILRAAVGQFPLG